MIVVAADGRNISFVSDIVAAKLVLEALRTITVDQLHIASDKVMKAGFDTFIPEAHAAVISFTTIMGQYLDGVVHISRVPKEQPAQVPEPAEVDPDEPPTNPVKVILQ